MSYDPNNIFAKILRGEAPCVKVYEDDATLAFMDIMPQTDGHVLIIPKAAAATLMDVPADALQATILTTQRLARAVKTAMQAPGIYVAQMNGEAAGQTVPHCHFHVIPRHPGRTYRDHATTMADSAVLEANAQKIRAALAE
ncbi:HIT family protein [Alcaligenaceae bacterium A4P071]|nr:HIT family protein [Alcaligenaceae bacterium B3P038]MDQ2185555.1 HIT family protein [Alcaligenaceae bacterium A4P071]